MVVITEKIVGEEGKRQERIIEFGMVVITDKFIFTYLP